MMSDLGAQPPVESSGAPADDAGPSSSDRPRSPDDAFPEPPPEPSGPDALAEALLRLREAQEYLGYRIAVEIDRLRLRFRRAASWAIVGIAGLAVLVAILMTAAGLLLWGVADLISRALGQPLWLGAVITGGGILALGAVTLWLALWSWNWSAFSSLRRRYAERRRRQREQFGRTIDRPTDGGQE